eukprot:3696173-Ditylum_brightwellii.AAC.1
MALVLKLYYNQVSLNEWNPGKSAMVEIKKPGNKEAEPQFLALLANKLKSFGANAGEIGAEGPKKN